MKKFFKYVHLWLSIPAGIIVTLMCLTGAIMVFQEEILRLGHPERYTVRDYSGEPLPLDEIVYRVNQTLENDTVTAIQITSDPGHTYVATLASGQRAHAYINPYTGDITGFYNYRAGFFHQVMRLHRWLMLKNTATGRIITGVSTLFLVVILISGVVAWWPRRSKFKKSFFQIKWKFGSLRRIFDLHRVLGIYAALFLLILSLTGLMWSFEWYRNGVMAIFGIERPAETGGGHGGGGRGGNRERTRTANDFWQNALDIGRLEITDFEYLRIAQNGTVTVLPLDAPHPRATDTYRYNVRENKLETTAIYRENRNQSYLMTWAYALHVGSWGGVWSKILSFLAALIGATLPVTGYLLWFRNKRKLIVTMK